MIGHRVEPSVNIVESGGGTGVNFGVREVDMMLVEHLG